MRHCFLCLAVLASPLAAYAQALRIALVVHGGVDDIRPGELSAGAEAAMRAGLTRALAAGYEVLHRGAAAVDAVEAALRTFEDDTLFDAGRGSVVNTAGVVELDAAIMDGHTLKAGAVAALRHIPHPISLARLVMDSTGHVMLVGDGAEQFALAHGVDTVPNAYFITTRRRQQYERWREIHRGDSTHARHQGTTGALALDTRGNLAAGTTTGGTLWKLPGRVGDSPIIGAGTYASNGLGCAVSASGTGEYFIRNTVAADICHRAAYLHRSLRQAAEAVVNQELRGQGGDGGVIVLDRTGRWAAVFNTAAFWRGSIDAAGHPVVEIFR